MTKEKLQAKLAFYQVEKEKLVHNLSAFNGAIEAIRALLVELEEEPLPLASEEKSI